MLRLDVPYIPLFMIRKNASIRIFIAATFIWWVIGFILLFCFSKKDLFLFVNAHHSTFGDWIMPYITQMGEAIALIVILIFLMIMDQKYRTRFIIITSILVLGLPPIISQIMKFAVEAPRPLLFFKDAPWIHIVEGYKNNYRYSWPSGHTTSAFSFFFLFSYFLNPRYKWLALLFVALALLVGYSRMYLAQHFFEDVLAGSIIGTTVPFLIVYFVEKIQAKRFPTIPKS